MPDRIAATVKNLRDFQKAFDLVGGGMKEMDVGHRKGEAATPFRETFETLTTDWPRNGRVRGHGQARRHNRKRSPARRARPGRRSPSTGQ
ncbi:putative T7SS-secreted protein [Streptomyces lunaelactis]|uniref:putative T7SS-secreted protein n=1 Tax=Streptomyces lunaelactis TaxID=1535768 RepID=UPI0034D9670B